MGLLGNGWNDPNSAAIMALAGNMVRGGLNGGFGGGLLAAQDAYQGAQDSQVRRQFTQAQIQNLQSEVEARRLALEKQQQLFGLLGGAFGGTQPATSAPSPMPGQLGSGSAGIVPPPAGSPVIPPAPAAQSSGSRLASMTPDQIALMKVLGVDMTEPWKISKEGFTKNPGTFSVDATTGRTTYNPDPTKGVDYSPDTRTVSALPGAAQTQGQLAFATEAPKTLLNAASTVNLRTMPDGSQRPVSALDENPTLQRILGGLYGSQTGAPMPSAAPPTARAPVMPMRGNPPPGSGLVAPQSPVDRVAILNSAMAQNKALLARPDLNDSDRARVQQDMNDIQRELGAMSTTNGVPNGLNIGAGPYGQTTTQANTAAANKTFLEGRAKGANEYETALNSQVQQGSELNMRLQEQLKALQNFRAGGGAETRAQLAQYAQAIPGVPDWVVKGVAGGDLSAMQEFNKLAAQTAMEQLKQSMGGAGRISQYEFKVFQNNNPNLSTDPDAIRKIFDFNTKIFNRDLTKQQAFGAFVKQGNDPAEFPAVWEQEQARTGITKPTLNAQGGAPNLVDALPKNAPKGARARDTQTGDILTFNGLSWVKGK